MSNPIVFEHYRCPEELVKFCVAETLSSASGFFRFGQATCYGQSSSAIPAKRLSDPLFDALQYVTLNGTTAYLPFDPAQVVDNLRLERYREALGGGDLELADRPIIQKLYYSLRPLLYASLRKKLQQIYLRHRKPHLFPAWPVDLTVESILEQLLALALQSHGLDKIPFIWFWPDGFQSCLIMTHDVETKTGRDFCADLMDIDDSAAIKSSFQIVPEKRYSISEGFFEDIRRRGFELNVQDLNHDGQLFSSLKQFRSRVQRINQYGKQYGAEGFRSAVLYRKPEWYDSLEFSYDMSIPNSAYLEPQQGGCCTVMPYFIGDILELPVTTTQDYSLFHLLGVYSIDLWKSEIASITEKHGLASFIVHPDYIQGDKPALDAYLALLKHISELRFRNRIWTPLPKEVDHWWRQRSQMTLVQENGKWRIEGEGRERARIAYASLAGNAVQYSMDAGTVLLDSEGCRSSK